MGNIKQAQECVEAERLTLVPPLEPRCGSWVAYAPGGRALLETYSMDTAEKLARHGCKVVTAMQHLISLNAGPSSLGH